MDDINCVLDFFNHTTHARCSMNPETVVTCTCDHLWFVVKVRSLSLKTGWLKQLKLQTSATDTGKGGDNRGSLPPAPSMRGAPSSAELFQTRSGSSFSSQASFFLLSNSHQCKLHISSAITCDLWADSETISQLTSSQTMKSDMWHISGYCFWVKPEAGTPYK